MERESRHVEYDGIQVYCMEKPSCDLHGDELDNGMNTQPTFLAFRNWLTEARMPYKKMRDITEADALVACDWLEEHGWMEKPVDLSNMAHLVPFDAIPTRVLVSRGFPHLIVRRAATGGSRNVHNAVYFRRGLLEDFCRFMHLSPAASINSRYELVPADLFNMVPPAEVQRAASAVSSGTWGSGNVGYFRGGLTGRSRAMRARFRREMIGTPLERALVAALPSHQMFGAIGPVFHQNGLIRVLDLLADWLEQHYGVRPDPASIIQAA